MSFGDIMFLSIVIGAMTVFGVTLAYADNCTSGRL